MNQYNEVISNDTITLFTGYDNFDCFQYNKLQVSIPIQLHEFLFHEKNRHLEKAVLTFLMLKSMPFREAGIIHHFNIQKKTIAQGCQISVPTLERHIRQLKDIGLINNINKHTLQLRSYDLLLSKLDPIKQKINYSRKKYVGSLKEFASNKLSFLTELFLANHKKQQHHQIRKQVRNIVSESIIKRSGAKKYKRMFKSNLVDDCIEYIQSEQLNLKTRISTFLSEEQINKIKDVDTDNNLSCFGIANYFNRKSAHTGSRRFKNTKAVSRKSRNVLVMTNASLRALYEIRDANEGFFFLKKGSIFKKRVFAYTIDMEVSFRRSDASASLSMCDF
jgi:hypothetical protein